MSEEFLESPISNEIFFDGLSDLHIENEVFRCTLFSRQKASGQDRRVEVARLICPAVELPDIITQIVTSLTNAAKVLVRVRVQDGH